MAILEKIRKRSLILILIIGLALFSFVISDFIGRGSFRGNASSIAQVNGTPISTQEFRSRVEAASQRNKYASTMQIVNSIWESMVRKELLNQEFENLGLGLPTSQIMEIVKSNPSITSSPNFQNKQGVFDANVFAEYIMELKTGNPAAYQQWKEQEKQLLDYFRQNSYFNMIKAGMISNPLEGEMLYRQENDSVSFEYVKIDYKTVNDSIIEVSDGEIKEYIKKHKNQYERKEPLRSVKFVYLEEKPSDKDINDIKTSLKKLLTPSVEYNRQTDSNDTIAGFANTSKAKAFVDRYSDIAFDDKLVFKEQLPQSFSEKLTKLKKEEVLGPYKDGDVFKMTRLLSTKKIADSSKASHIFTTYKGSLAANKQTTKTKKEAKTYIDSIFKIVKRNPEKFEQIADSINADGTKGKGGDIGWQRYSTISYQNFDRDFAEFMFFKPKGAMEVVETQMGYHIIKVEDQRTRKDAYLFATVARRIEPSEETINNVFNQATQLEMDVAQSKKTIEEAAQSQNLNVRMASDLRKIDENVSSLARQRGIVQWAFNENTQKGQIKQFSVNRGYAVVVLDDIKKQGIMTVEEARPLIKPLLIKKKKYAIITEKYKEQSIEDIAKNSKSQIYKQSAVTMKNPMVGTLDEPAVIGTAFALKKGMSSGFIKGDKGVYKIRVSKNIKASDLPNYSSYFSKTDNRIRMGAENKIFTTLKELSDIEDNRTLFY